jgi:hypothetical protein
LAVGGGLGEVLRQFQGSSWWSPDRYGRIFFTWDWPRLPAIWPRKNLNALSRWTRRMSVNASSTIMPAKWPRLACRGDHAMSSLPPWAAWAIVAACPLLGPVIAFLMFFAVVVLDRWITGAREAPALVPVAAGVLGGHLRRRLAWGAPDPVPELVHSGSAVAAPLGSLPPR